MYLRRDWEYSRMARPSLPPRPIPPVHPALIFPAPDRHSRTTAGFGVRGQTAAAGGFSMGVRGEATSTTGSVIGVSGFTASSGGFGVEGFANDATGSTLGVRGVVSSPNGVAGQFENNGGGLIL